MACRERKYNSWAFCNLSFNSFLFKSQQIAASMTTSRSISNFATRASGPRNEYRLKKVAGWLPVWRRGRRSIIVLTIRLGTWRVSAGRLTCICRTQTRAHESLSKKNPSCDSSLFKYAAEPFWDESSESNLIWVGSRLAWVGNPRWGKRWWACEVDP